MGMGKRDEMILLVRSGLERLIREETEFVILLAVPTVKKFLETHNLEDIKVKTAILGVLPSCVEAKVANELLDLVLAFHLGRLDKQPLGEEEL